MRLIFAAIFLLFAFCRVATADANRKETNESIARLRFQVGERLYREGRYREALNEFKAGFALTGRPAFLLNIAQCQRKVGDLEAARDNFYWFLEADPDSPHAVEARGVLAEVEAELKAHPKSTATAPPPSTSEESPLTKEKLRAMLEEAGVKLEAEHRPTPVYKKWWLWTTVAVVAVGIGLGVGLGVGLSGKSNTNVPGYHLPALVQF